MGLSDPVWPSVSREDAIRRQTMVVPDISRIAVPAAGSSRAHFELFTIDPNEESSRRALWDEDPAETRSLDRMRDIISRDRSASDWTLRNRPLNMSGVHTLSTPMTEGTIDYMREVLGLDPTPAQLNNSKIKGRLELLDENAELKAKVKELEEKLSLHADVIERSIKHNNLQKGLRG